MVRFLKKEATACVNGVFIMIVFISHLRTYMTLAPGLDWAMRGFSQLMVATFLFYSGFGVMESIRSKGMSYVKRIPVHRVLGVLAMFIPAVLMYGIFDLIVGETITWDRFLLSLIAWKNLGNSSWYIFVILCLYLITWLAWILADKITLYIKKKRNPSDREYILGDQRDIWGFVLSVLLSVGLIIALHYAAEEYYYNTVSAYLFGLFFSQNKDHILRVCGFGSDGRISGFRGAVSYIGMTVVTIVTTYLLRKYLEMDYEDLTFLVMTVFFCMGVVLLSYLVPFPDYVLRWIGEHLFEIYILMRLPMMALLYVPGWEQGGLWYALTSLVITLILAWIYHAVVVRIKQMAGRKRLESKSGTR